jgi:hypothetical protein
MPRGRRRDAALEGFAEDIGKLLGTAQGKAERWLVERKTIVRQLEDLRNVATQLLSQMTPGAKGGPRRTLASDVAVVKVVRKGPRISAKGRAAIAAAQRARWAKVRAAKAAKKR